MSDFVIRPILVTCYRLLPLSPLSLSSQYLSSLPNSPPVPHPSFCCHSTLVIRLSVVIMVLLIIVHQIHIQTFHPDEVRGVIQRGPVKPAASSVGVTGLNCIIVPAKRVRLPLGCERITLRYSADTLTDFILLHSSLQLDTHIGSQLQQWTEWWQRIIFLLTYNTIWSALQV